MLDSLGTLQRTHYCGDLRAGDADKDVVLMGWVHRRRDLGTLLFIDLRDRTGLAQIVFNKEQHAAAHARAEELRAEYVVAVLGRVVKRQKPNPELASGDVEIIASELRILNTAKTPPFVVEDEVTASEETRLRYRYLDLRRPRPGRNLALRHRIILEIRRAMDEMGFYEVETPMLTRSTPEGARDYLVPSRVHPGQFYALPQSPQIFKQILMISGLDRYFQIVKCFRDEDLRADRQPEFTQLDLEISFPTQDTVFGVIERVMERACEVANKFRRLEEGDPPISAKTPFPRMTYSDAMRRYGSDKPDLRYPGAFVKLDDIVSAAVGDEFGIICPIIGFHFSQQNPQSLLSKTAVKNLVQTVVEVAAQGLPDLKARTQELGRQSLFIDWCILGQGHQLLKRPDLAELIANRVGAKQGDILFLGALRGGSRPRDQFLIHRCFGTLRNRVQHFSKDFDPKLWQFVWITDFALFEWSESEKCVVSAQHPFTGIVEEDLPKLEDPSDELRLSMRSKGYDLVLNGSELGSGSIRIHQQELQARVFKALGLSPEQQRARFGFFLDALTYGTPPHGGIALGLDRVVALLAGEKSIREVIAFPKTAKAQDLMAEAPAPVDADQLDMLGIRLKSIDEK